MSEIDMSEFVKIANLSELPPGEAACYTVDEKIIGLFNVDGKVHAINDLCPHMGASLSAGYFEEDTVCCPWHAWRFRVTDGTWCDNPKLKIDTYSVEVRGDEIWVAKNPNPKDGEAKADSKAQGCDKCQDEKSDNSSDGNDGDAATS